MVQCPKERRNISTVNVRKTAFFCSRPELHIPEISGMNKDRRDFTPCLGIQVHREKGGGVTAKPFPGIFQGGTKTTVSLPSASPQFAGSLLRGILKKLKIGKQASAMRKDGCFHVQLRHKFEQSEEMKCIVRKRRREAKVRALVRELGAKNGRFLGFARDAPVFCQN